MLRQAERLEIHYTPKHGSWLDMAEIELAVLARQCLDRRIPDQETLRKDTWPLGEPAQPRRRCRLAFHYRGRPYQAQVPLSLNSILMTY